MRRQIAAVALGVWAFTQVVWGLGQPQLVRTEAGPDAFCLVAGGKAAPIVVDPGEYPGVARAAKDLAGDLGRVSGVTPSLISQADAAGPTAVVIGTLGKGGLVDQLARAGVVDVSGISGKWEATLIQTLSRPLPGVEKALLIAGSDKRGTIYGIYELSEQMGVSPWYWWADVPPKHRTSLYVSAGPHLLGPPGVKYRGIFLNDEGPCLMTWARAKYGELNHGMYTNVFELILRLKGNYLWPAMWDNSFATDDPLTAKLADEYGIIVGTSHHEPMMRAWKEWERAGHPKGSWDYVKNAPTLRAFWEEGVKRTKDYEKVITIGMRGDGDEPMSETESITLLEQIVADQRQIIGRVLNTNAAAVPQVWALYKEVQGYYEKGMRVPEDVTLLWCDDNWGNLRRLPTAAERQRPGGAGIYYHFDYVGGPRNYKWLNTILLSKVWEQLHLARQYQADRLWIANVGDLKPLEVPLEFFLALAWNPERWNKNSASDFLAQWAEREFGPEHAADIAEIVSKYTQYNGRRKPELLEPGTFSLEHYGEADRVLGDWRQITAKAERLYSELPPEQRDAFFELVLYPTKASAVVNELYVAVAQNRFYAARGDGRANTYAQRARALFQEDARLAEEYNHKLAGGKWNHMMDQTHIGYTGWQQPGSNSLPAVVEVTNAVANVDALSPDRAGTNSATLVPRGWKGHIEADGYVSIEAEHFARKVDLFSVRWEVLPGHGRTLSGMTITPVTAPSVEPPANSPCLEYPLWLTTTGRVEVLALLSPSLNFAPERGVRLAVSLDQEPPQVLTIVPKDYRAGDGNRDWETSVKDSIRQVRSTQVVPTPGAHTLKVWMVDPGVVLQKLVVDCGGLQPSYLGPPESPHIAALTAEQDHERMRRLLGIASLRPGRNGMDRNSPDYAHYDEARANPFPHLPDPLQLKNGRRVTTAEEWFKLRRPEIVEDFDREVYGRVPTNVPAVHWKVLRTTIETNSGVRVLTKQVAGEVNNASCPGVSVTIPLTLSTPADLKTPVPVVMQLAFNFGGRGPSLGNRTNRFGGGAFGAGPSWQAQVLQRGWGVAVLTPTSIQPDNGAGLAEGIIGLCNQGQPRQPEDWGALRAWAWGVSRALDYLQTEPSVDARRVAVEGHSRYGKAALVALAYDPRLATAYVSSSGEGGAKLHRRDWGEIVENLASSGEYHWMAGNFLKYAGPLGWNDLPVDAHELIALCAPRPVFFGVGSTNGDAWVDAKGTFLAAAAAGPVYELLGKQGLGTTDFPPLGTALTSGDVAFRQHEGGHTDAPNWPTFLNFAARYFR